jgi:hypothetical protein
MATDYLDLITGKKLGEFFLDNFTDYDQTKKLATEAWETKEASVLTLEQEAYALEVIYHHKIKQAISCIIYNPDSTLLEQLQNRGLFEGDLYDMEDQLVIVKAETTTFLDKDNHGNFSQVKTQFPLTKSQLELIEKLFTKNCHQ